MHAGGGGYNGGNGGTIGQTTNAPSTGTGAGGAHALFTFCSLYGTLIRMVLSLKVQPGHWLGRPFGRYAFGGGRKGRHKLPCSPSCMRHMKCMCLGGLQGSSTTLNIAERKHHRLIAMQFVAQFTACDTWLLQEAAVTGIHLRSRAPLH